MVWIHKLQIPALIRHQRSSPKHRFIDIAGAAASPLLKPLISLAACAFMWHAFKSIITEPLRLKQQTELTKFKEALEQHKKNVAAALERQASDYAAKHTALLASVTATEKDIDKELRKLRADNKIMMEDIKKNTFSALATQEERNKALQEKLAAERKALEEQFKELDAHQDMRHMLLASNMDDIQADLADLKQSVQGTRATTNAMEQKTGEAVTGLAQIKHDVRLLTVQSSKTVEALKLLVPARKTARLW